MFTIDNETNKITIIKKDTALFALELDNHVLSEGDQVIFTIAATKQAEQPLVQKVIETFTQGMAVISLTSEDTNLEKGTYYYDIQVNIADGRIDTVVGPAKVKIIEGVTY